MRFLWPDLLWLLLAIPVLVAVYVHVLRKKKNSALRYASLMLVRDALGPGPQFALAPARVEREGDRVRDVHQDVAVRGEESGVIDVEQDETKEARRRAQHVHRQSRLSLDSGDVEAVGRLGCADAPLL